MCGMAREDLHFRLRIPEDLKKRVQEAAEKNGHSMTAEIIERLTWTFDTHFYRENPKDPIGFNTSFDNLIRDIEILGAAIVQEEAILSSAESGMPDTSEDQHKLFITNLRYRIMEMRNRYKRLVTEAGLEIDPNNFRNLTIPQKKS